MIMPTKITQAVDSFIVIGAEVLSLLKKQNYSLDELLERINEKYYKKILIEDLILSIEFLFLIDKVRIENETITINIIKS